MDNFTLWPQICRKYGISEEQERAFIHDVDASRSDCAHYSATHEEKRTLEAELCDKKCMYEEALTTLDETLPARLANHAARDQDVVRAARVLGMHRLIIAERVAACQSEYLDMANAAACDKQLWREASEARAELCGYYERARGRYWYDRHMERPSRNRGADACWAHRVYRVPHTDNVPHYMGRGGADAP